LVGVNGYDLSRKSDLWDYTNISWGYHYRNPKNILSTSTALTEIFSEFTIDKYYNVTEFEIEEKYLTIFVRNIRTIIYDKNIDTIRYQMERYGVEIAKSKYKGVGFLMYLPYFTKDELAVIRNCLFAQRGYKFETEYWSKFIKTYYNKDYKGFYTNSETLRLFTDDEKWFLNLILRYENNGIRRNGI
jgi:hypothetical protein